jgi:diguanylate cyclase (GGDEF)-like protein/PAS domain S-box-containing protein
LAKKSLKIFLLLSLLIFCLDVIFILINYYSSRRILNEQFAEISTEVEAAFIQAQEATEQRMLQIATFVAADHEVQKLFLEGGKAVAREGGGAGGVEALAIRKELYNRVAASRDALAADYDFRQLQFHLGPGSLSFLRVHAPEKFGDNMDTVRHTVVTVNHTHEPVSGFETGRVYSGIRGVVPVFINETEGGKPLHVGALEAGTSYQYTLENASRPRRVGMAVLLRVQHLEKNVWPDFLQNFLQKNPPVSGLALECTTDPVILTILNNGLLPRDKERLAWQVDDISGEPHLVVRFPLYDFAGSHDRNLPAVGSVVVWKAVSAPLTNLYSSLKTNIIYGIFGFLVTELLLYLGLYLAAGKLERLVERGRQDLACSLEQLRQSEEKFLTMAEFSVDWDAWRGIEGEYLYVTPSCKEVSGYSREEFYQSPEFFLTILHPDDRKLFVEHQRLHYRDKAEPAELSFRIIRKDGEVRWIWHKCQAVFAGDGSWQGRRTTNRDITVLKNAEEKLQQLSTTDTLTGAYNRRMFMDALGREMKRASRYGKPFSLLMFDIDHFKVVNDEFGHDVGDRTLIEVVRLSAKAIRESDVLARWGGEEFMVLLPETTMDMALSLSGRLRERISEHEFADIGHLTISIGVAHLDQDDTVDTLLKRVDGAMYVAKESGRNQVVSG